MLYVRIRWRYRCQYINSGSYFYFPLCRLKNYLLYLVLCLYTGIPFKYGVYAHILIYLGILCKVHIGSTYRIHLCAPTTEVKAYYVRIIRHIKSYRATLHNFYSLRIICRTRRHESYRCLIARWRTLLKYVYFYCLFYVRTIR